MAGDYTGKNTAGKRVGLHYSAFWALFENPISATQALARWNIFSEGRIREVGLDLSEVTRGDLVYSVNIGAYSHASATWFNGFPPAKVVHENR